MSNWNLLTHTKSLLKMMMSVTQLSEMQFPLKIRKPGEKMSNLGRDIAMLLNPSTLCTHQFLASFGSSETRLAISSAMLNRIDSSLPMLEGVQLDLNRILSLLKMEDKNGTADSTDAFQMLSDDIRHCIIGTIDSYLKHFLLAKTWYLIRDRYCHPSRSVCAAQEKSNMAFDSCSELASELFSVSYKFDHLLNDLKLTKQLLRYSRGTKSLYSSISTC